MLHMFVVKFVAMASCAAGRPMANFILLPVALALCVCAVGGQQLIAPLDADRECLDSTNSSTLLEQAGSSSQLVLLDSYHYRSLQNLWYPDDETIDLFEFPVPVDLVRWRLVDQSECRNVWQYCGTSSSDILITQFITGALNRTNNEVIIAVEYAFFNNGLSMDMESADDQVLIVEVDDTTGLSNVHTELIPQNPGTQQPIYHDFIYVPMNGYFEIVFRANLTEGTCVNISRVLVFHCAIDRIPVENLDSNTATCIPCPDGYYLDAKLIECLPCPSHSSSTNARSNHCVCDAGYERSSNPTNYSLPCDQCASGYYMTDNDSCVACPLPGYDTGGSMMDECRCFNATPSVNLTCNFCADNYIRNASTNECVLCPTGSRRELLLDALGHPLLEFEQYCACIGGSLTRNGGNITTLEPCDNCDESKYWNTTQCVPCPAHSRQSTANSTQCGCDFGSLTLAGDNLTTTESCFCMSGLYRALGSGQCQTCPSNSHRALNEPQDICVCFEGHRRETGEVVSLPCLTYVGFNTSSLVLREGNNVEAHIITIALSQTSTSALSVSIIMEMDQNRSVEVTVGPNNVRFLAGTDRFDVILTYPGNLVALEEDMILNLSLTAVNTEELLIGGPGLYGDLDIVIRDDDLLYVGFTENLFVYESSEQGGSIELSISTEIGQNLVLLIRSNDTLSSSNSARTYEFIFTVGENVNSKNFHFDLGGNREDKYVLLTVEVATYPESLNRVRDRITVGQVEGLYHEAVIVIGGSGLLSQSAMIGIISSVVVVCFNMIVIMLVAIFCLCYRNLKTAPKSPQQSPRSAELLEMPKLKELAAEVED